MPSHLLSVSHFQAPYANVPLDEQKYELRNLRYDVSLDLVVPAIERNLDLGQSNEPRRCITLSVAS